MLPTCLQSLSAKPHTDKGLLAGGMDVRKLKVKARLTFLLVRLRNLCPHVFPAPGNAVGA